VITAAAATSMTSASDASSSRVKTPRFFDFRPYVANTENMSSKVQLWRPPVTEPSAAQISSLIIVTNTCGERSYPSAGRRLITSGWLEMV
jgi:hypothetical protein